MRPLPELAVSAASLDLGVLGHFKEAVDLVDLALDLLLEDELGEEPADVLLGEIQLLREEIQAHRLVGLDPRDQDVQPDVTQQVVQVLADEGVVQDLRLLVVQD